jgi:hypothetical protein
MTTAAIFAKHAAARMDLPCPATQDAIDRLVTAELFRGRNGMLEAMSGPHYGPSQFNSSLLSAWKDKDIELATGHNRDWWLRLADKMG